ncbi:hypothetical protein GJ744_011740 [Endocarpon pusillum]|uniref:Invertebrate defensins family profile domain-containing protein n=1 Tax=Endocarpon pusillum TaxID=364733 RepID=A0A8H7ACA3_9EURO|nr:hypothetical protein GJ744_011740 [Endocarpon pusillum]
MREVEEKRCYCSSRHGLNLGNLPNMQAVKLILLFIGLAMATPIDNPLLDKRSCVPCVPYCCKQAGCNGYLHCDGSYCQTDANGHSHCVCKCRYG